ncbi:hypothetical protein HDU79_004990 [Rhizoclosmatium sp. JEL0117]|nr:hypothetical protein HDU79_004990 [Rhizoclosmatium sp. JEL0117]
MATHQLRRQSRNLASSALVLFTVVSAQPTAVPPQPNLLTDGDFAAAPSIPGWQPAACSNVTIAPCVEGAFNVIRDGRFSDASVLALNSKDGPASVYQDLVLPAGFAGFELSFDLNFDPGCSTSSGLLKVRFVRLDKGDDIYNGAVKAVTGFDGGNTLAGPFSPKVIDLGSEVCGRVRVLFTSMTVGACGPLVAKVRLGTIGSQLEGVTCVSGSVVAAGTGNRLSATASSVVNGPLAGASGSNSIPNSEALPVTGSSGPKIPVGAVVGVFIAALVVVGGILAAFVWMCRRKERLARRETKLQGSDFLVNHDGILVTKTTTRIDSQSLTLPQHTTGLKDRNLSRPRLNHQLNQPSGSGRGSRRPLPCMPQTNSPALEFLTTDPSPTITPEEALLNEKLQLMERYQSETRCLPSDPATWDVDDTAEWVARIPRIGGILKEEIQDHQLTFMEIRAISQRSRADVQVELGLSLGEVLQLESAMEHVVSTQPVPQYH